MNIITVDEETLKRMITEAVNNEREACAKVCDITGPDDWTSENCAAKIRARGQV